MELFWPLGEEAGLPLGVRAGEHYPESSQTLAPGDTLLFYTDGITEAAGPKHTQFGVEGSRQGVAPKNRAIRRPNCSQPLKPAPVHEFTHGHAPDDDRTVLAACRGRGENPSRVRAVNSIPPCQGGGGKGSGICVN